MPRGERIDSTVLAGSIGLVKMGRRAGVCCVLGAEPRRAVIGSFRGGGRRSMELSTGRRERRFGLRKGFRDIDVLVCVSGGRLVCGAAIS